MFPLAHFAGALVAALVLERLTNVRFDYRWVIVGGMLPDLVDKLIGHGIFHGTVDDGRLMCHTMLAVVLMVAAARYRPNWVTKGLAVGFSMHVVLDFMWNDPKCFFWPLYGLDFPISPSDPSMWIETLLTDPVVMTGELVGGAVLLAFAVKLDLFRNGNLKRFFTRGWTADGPL